MITTAQEYYKNLYRIQTTNIPDRARLIPSDEPIYEIDLDTRYIKGPKTLSVAHDHNAETVYFKVPRYFDNIDLTTKVAVVQYINANGIAGIYPIPFYDISTKPGFILMPWEISGRATEKDGVVKYNIIFFEIEKNSNNIYNFVYKLNTVPAEGRVLYGLDIHEEVYEDYEITADLLDEIHKALRDCQDAMQITWLEL